MKRKLFLCAALGAVICACVSFAACSLFAKRKENPPEDFTVGEITDHSIEICDWLDANGEKGRIIFSIDGEEWVEAGLDGYVFTGLVSNTEYTLYARIPGWGDTVSSDSITKTATTLRSVNAALPEVGYEQERGKITLTGVTSEMETSFDGGQTYSDIYEHIYTQKGGYEILVRYKQTDRAFAGEPVSLTVEYSDFYAGRGTEENPYLVTSYDELRLLNDKDNYYKLTNDIVFPDEEVSPITFSGDLDGNGKKFISPKIRDEENGKAAIFDGVVSAKNLTVENAVINACYNPSAQTNNPTVYAAILTTHSKNLTNCRVNGSVNFLSATNVSSATYCGGGIASTISNLGYRIENCSADVEFTFDVNGSDCKNTLYLGGIVSLLRERAVVSGCTAKAQFFAFNDNFSKIVAGGICARFQDSERISGCLAEVDIYADAYDWNLGGIAGEAYVYSQNIALIENCFVSGEITALNNGHDYNRFCGIGGVLGGYYISATCNILSCISDVDISVRGTGLNVFSGGMIGYSMGSKYVKNCLYTGNLAVDFDPTKKNASGAVLGYVSTAYTVENCFVKVQPMTSVDCSQATEVEEEEYLSAQWQRENLNLDESIWEIRDGELPALK